MHRLRHIAVWFLLAAVVAGGVGGPVVHHLQHAAESAEIASDSSCHSSAFHHADVPVVADAASEVTAPECNLCATRLLVVLPDVSPTSGPTMEGTAQVVLRTHLASVYVATDRTIRGPPFVSGARLA
ncbi:hypothetical protein BSZ35_14555 [Salinibacter sp. 10B]|uniref:hypothetical protein n=1 Tax=Salinibacter sp. 10B TaxID=1923971 RepID=UPI000CF49FB0|nr:hypothetical protein [Salinibacter sp. 10B]PQJ35654.1 hypothetical protein BSZ35_14555 [Salinibacter sp. 10B]